MTLKHDQTFSSQEVNLYFTQFVKTLKYGLLQSKTNILP